MGANSETAISARAIPQEPMVRMTRSLNMQMLTHRVQYLIMNLGMSKNFGTVDLANVSLGMPLFVLVIHD